MNSSAKLSLTLLGAAALGALAFACTVGSGTVDDVDGGTTSGGTSGATSGGTSGTSVTASDAGTDAAPACAAYEGANLDSQGCQDCLDMNCKCETGACWNVGDDKDASTLGCDGYQGCLNTCDDDPKPGECKTGICKATARTEIPELYNAYLACRTDRCASQCPTVSPDGGAP